MLSGDPSDQVLLIRLETSNPGVSATALAWLLAGLDDVARSSEFFGPTGNLTINHVASGSIFIWLSAEEWLGIGAIAGILGGLCAAIPLFVNGKRGANALSLAADRLLHHEGVQEIEIRCGKDSIIIRRSDVPTNVNHNPPSGLLAALTSSQRAWLAQVEDPSTAAAAAQTMAEARARRQVAGRVTIPSLDGRFLRKPRAPLETFDGNVVSFFREDGMIRAEFLTRRDSHPEVVMRNAPETVELKARYRIFGEAGDVRNPPSEDFVEIIVLDRIEEALLFT